MTPTPPRKIRDTFPEADEVGRTVSLPREVELQCPERQAVPGQTDRLSPQLQMSRDGSSRAQADPG